ncbi:hypothetical protein LVY74_00440 [Acinetobacter sp. ME22]|uniref:hypothetical protein n=1 Tax=Acinetobacter sp. ME22 TaxID=2904802 RepID=UPI001EDB7C99|nr:hypothetical protein [Acinetobacter sp. ME22]MCG2572027.1 hypothetical protein [Acinetobacter sp. ME22]
MKQTNSGLQYDSQGFLIGAIQPKVDQIDQNVTEILKVLRGQIRQQVEQYRASKLQIDILQAKNVKSFDQALSELTAKKAQQKKKQPHRQLVGKAKIFDRSNYQDKADPQSKSTGQDDQNQINGAAEAISRLGSYVGDLADTAKGMAGDSRGIDPSVDAIHELGTVFTPVKNMAVATLKPLTAVAKIKKRNEPLEKEASEHNRKQIKVLTRITGKMSSGGGFFKSLLKKFSVLGGIGVLGLLASSEANADEGSEGELTQAAAQPKPQIAAHASTVKSGHSSSQSDIGISQSSVDNEMKSTVTPHVKNYTENLKKGDVPKHMESHWDKFISNSKNAVKQAWGKFIGFFGGGGGPDSVTEGDQGGSTVLGDSGVPVTNASGLRLKSAETTAGGNANKGTLSMAQSMQNTLGNQLYYFGSINDKWHKQHKPNSKHTQGLAFDITLRGKQGKASNAEGRTMAPSVIASIKAKMAASGLSAQDFKVLDEYTNPSKGATGGHVHFQFNSQQAADKYYKAVKDAELRKQQDAKAKQQQPQTTAMTKNSAVATAKSAGSKVETASSFKAPQIEQAITTVKNTNPKKIMIMNQSAQSDLVAENRSLVHASTGSFSA